MKRLLLLTLGVSGFFTMSAQVVTTTWVSSSPETLSEASMVGDQTVMPLLSTNVQLGKNISSARVLNVSTADAGYEPVTYTPTFTAFTPKMKVTSKGAGHCIQYTITPQEGHKFMPTTISFDAVKVGTDAGNIELYYQIGSGTEVDINTNITPVRNKISETNSTGFSHFEYSLIDKYANGEPFSVFFYLKNINGANVSTPKEIGLRNVTVTGYVDYELKNCDYYVKAFTFKSSTDSEAPSTLDIAPFLASVHNGETVQYDKLLYYHPTDFKLVTAPGFDYKLSYDDKTHVAKVSITENSNEVFTFGIEFKISNRAPKPKAKPLNRGLMALSLSGANMGSGNLVSWRHREADGYGVKYKLYRGYTADDQNTALNGGKYILDRTNFNDKTGTAACYYKLETYSAEGVLLETEVSRKTWNDQTFRIPTECPTDPLHGATYTPNDASYCDMDGDGEYEIILKWSPSNEKDAASSGTTSPAIFDCLKLDGTRLWRINSGPNFFNSAHTMQFIAWDFDGDGYGEFMMKTAPGTVDGLGNYVLLGNDDPKANLLSGRGKQDHGSEYITVFDGLTGAELATIPYHTPYGAVSTSIWGDSSQNRSERYLAGLAYLDGPDANPSPIFARGYYSGAFVAAYDWDGVTLSERWVSRNTTSGQGLWGEGAHWMACGDCDGDGKHEIVYGSAALDHDGSLLYRTGFGHGDALHLGDFLPDRKGLEVYMVHEKSPYGCDLRDAKTGAVIHRITASGDTGRGVAGHFDSFYDHSQFSHSADAGMFSCLDGKKYADGWTPGGGGSMNNRIYWDGDLYDEHYDKSCLAKWDHGYLNFGRIKVNNGNYTIGKMNNYTKYNPCVLGDLLGDWREEIILWDEANFDLIINATSYESEYRIPHLMDDLNYRVQVVNQNCCYNQPPHLSVDPSRVYAGNPNHATDSDNTSIEETLGGNEPAEDIIYNMQGIRIPEITQPGIYIRNGKKIVVSF